MYGTNKSAGFGLLEILIAIAIIGMLMTFAIPNIQKLMPRYERETFIARLNALLQLGWQNAIMSHTLHRVSFHFGKKQISLEKQTDETDKDGEPKFAPLKGQYIKNSLSIPDSIEVKQFFSEGFDEMGRIAGGKTTEAWFYIVPAGLAQEVIINFIDKKDRIAKKPRPIGLVLNPFNAQFKTYDTFQK